MPDLPTRPLSVPPQPLGSLLPRLDQARLTGDSDVAVTGITHDSRSVRPGDLYVAREGAATHGVEHVEAAADAGAVAVLTDAESHERAAATGLPVVVVADPRVAIGPAAAWAYHDPAETLQLFGVTGTNGKTTTAYLLEAGLRAAGRNPALIGTIETRLGGRRLPSARTTPEATDLQALLAVLREACADSVAMEVSSHALALDRVGGLRFDVALFTNLSQDHLDFHPDMASYYAAKARLFTPELSRQAVVCIDDEWGQRLAREAEVPVTTVGRRGAEWVRTDEPASGRCRLVGPEAEDVWLTTSLAGTVNLANAAIAYVALRRVGADADAVRRGIAELAGVPGRMERVEAGQPFAVLVDYAHTPAALAALIATARELAGGHRVIVVVGCGGDRDRAKRPQMGNTAATADLAILTSDNPRSEDPAAILDAMRSGVPAGAEVTSILDRRVAIEHAIDAARTGDVVVIAGKGHEQGQEIAGVVSPFDDRLVAREALSHRRAGAS